MSTEEQEKAKLQRQSILHAVAALLERAEVHDTYVNGFLDGQEVTYLLNRDDDGSSWHTRVSSPAPTGFFLDVRRSTPLDEREVKEGLAVDHQLEPSGSNDGGGVGDGHGGSEKSATGFDAMFIVEGAPERHVRAMLTTDVRERLIAAQPATLRTDKNAFVMMAPHWVGGGDAEGGGGGGVNEKDMIRGRAMLWIVSNVSATAKRLVDERKREGAGYRGTGGHAPLAEHDAREVDEAVARNVQRLARREARRVLILLIVVGVALGGSMLYVLLSER